MAAFSARPDQKAAAESLRLLYGFLAGQAGWDRCSPPELRRYLTWDAIDAFVAPERLPNVAAVTRRGYRARLLTLADVVHGAAKRRRHTSSRQQPAHQQPARQPSDGAAAFWPTVVSEGPFVALAAGYGRKGHDLTRFTWRGLDLARGLVERPSGRGSAALAAVSTVEPLSDAARLRSITDVTFELTPPAGGLVSKGNDPATSSHRKAARPVSRSAAVRQARAAHKAAQEAAASTAGRDVGPSAVDLATRSVRQAEAIARYRPRLGTTTPPWEAIEVATHALLRAYDPPSQAEVWNKGGILSRFAGWVWRRSEHGAQRGALTPDELLDPGLVEAYLDGPLRDAPEGSKATVRWVLRRALLALAGRPAPERYPRSRVKPPYTPAECAAFVRQARIQPTRSRQRALLALVGLGLGAGLDGREQRLITPERLFDIDLGGGVVALGIRVPAPRERLVVVRAAYELLVREAGAIHEEEGRRRDQPLYGTTTARRNVTTGAKKRGVTATGAPIEIDASRLRSTWLVAAMCADLPLGTLLHAAGLRSPSSFVDLLAYCPVPDPMDVARIERALRDPVAAETAADSAAPGGHA